MFRGRDLVAALLAVLLTRMAWTENYASESLSATFRLAFYAPWTSAMDETSASPVPVDVDGDGTVEAVAMATRLNTTESSPASWTIEVVDLKPLHKSIHSGPQTNPFRPTMLFTSQAITSPSSDEHEEFIPLKMTSGQVVVKHRHHHHHHHHHTHVEEDHTKSDDRTRHFFCGRDWHDATTNCHQHCPGGTSSECPDEMMCYADTMCDALRTHSSGDDGDIKLELTPGGGLPSIATLWSDGTVTLHSITADVNEEEQHEKHRPKRHHSPSRLELRLMWKSSKLLEHLGDEYMMEEADVILLGAEDVIPASSGSKKGLGKYGMVVVGGTYSTPEHYSIPFVQALDAMKGEFMWEEAPTETENENEEVNTTVVRGSTSHARRRSRIISVTSEKEPADTGTPNCMISFRHSLLDPATGALPHTYWGPFDSRLVATHLNRHKRRHTKQQKGQGKKKKWPSPLVQKGESHKMDAVYGRPNVLICHHEGGIQVRSLKNGRPVCHISLLEEALYADLNNDGILDHVQVITDESSAMANPETGEYSDKWVTDLVRRVETASEKEKQKGFSQRVSASSRLCHILALSGLPAREELFSAPLCSSNSPSRNRQGDHPALNNYLTSAPPLVVERMDGQSHAGSDVVVAMNNGMMSRFQAPTGKRQWQISHQEALPTWGADDGSGAPFLSRIDFVKAAYLPWIRPILVTGEDGMALLSAGQGRLLATTTFPQTSIGRPVLADVSGDGTTDVVIVSADAIWGYQVVVRTGGSIVFRVMVGLLLVGVGIALLRNRFGQRQGVDKRSTDG